MIINEEDDDDDDDDDESKSPIKYEESGSNLSPDEEKAKLLAPVPPSVPTPANKAPSDTKSLDEETACSPLSDHKSMNSIKSEITSSSPKSSVPYSMVQSVDPVSNPTKSIRNPISPSIQQPSVSDTPLMHDKIHTIPPPQSHEPPAKMPRRDIRLEESAMARHQQMRYLDLLSRLFPEQKRGVIELILKGCNGDIVQAIECILPSHERAVAQMSGMPGQSFTLPPAGVEETNRQRFNANEKQNMSMSAFMPFNTHHGQPQHPPAHSQHGYTMVPVPPCPPGCTCQMSQKCPCPDCVPSNASKMPHLKKHEANGPKDAHSSSPVATTSFSDIAVSPKEAIGMLP